MTVFFTTLGLIGAAEMGDKTRLLTLALAVSFFLAARQALCILETPGIAPLTAALLRAALETAREPIVADTPNRRLRHGVPVREERRCPI